MLLLREDDRISSRVKFMLQDLQTRMRMWTQDEETKTPDPPVVQEPIGHSEQEEEFVNWRESVNESNELGIDFTVYDEIKPPHEVRQRIHKYVESFIHDKNKPWALEQFEEITRECELKELVFGGYIY